MAKDRYFYYQVKQETVDLTQLKNIDKKHEGLIESKDIFGGILLVASKYGENYELVTIYEVAKEEFSTYMNKWKMVDDNQNKNNIVIR